MNEGQQLTIADAEKELTRTVRRLRERVLRYAAGVENKVALVKQVAHTGNPAALSERGELQQLAAGFDAAVAALVAAVAALVTANEALGLVSRVRSPDPLERQPCVACGGGYFQALTPTGSAKYIPHDQECSLNAALRGQS